MNRQQIITFKMPRYHELPNMDLYIDQVLLYIESILAPLEIDKEEKLLTSSMVNNYVKKGIVPPTVKKKYSKVHIAYLFIVCFSKQIFSMDEISGMIQVQNSCFDIETAYNYMCDELENILSATFQDKPLKPDSTKTQATQRFFVRNTLIAFANKLFTQKLLQQYHPFE